MTERDLTIPVAQEASLAEQITQLRRWLEGYTDIEGRRQPGLIATVGELYEELKTRRERKEALARNLASGGVLAVFTAGIAWLMNNHK